MTKNELVKLIVREKERQLQVLKAKNDGEVFNLKRNTIIELFEEDIKALNETGLAFNKAIDKFREKVEAQKYKVGFEFYSNVTTASSTLVRNASEQTTEGIVSCLMNNQFVINSTELGNKIDAIRKSETELEDEWNKLIIIIKSLSLKEGRKYLEECKIEIPGMNEEPKQTALVNYTVDVTKLFINEES